MTDVGSDPCVNDCITPSFLVSHVGQACTDTTVDSRQAVVTIPYRTYLDGATDAYQERSDAIVMESVMAAAGYVSSALHVPGRRRPSRPCFPSSIAHGS